MNRNSVTEYIKTLISICVPKSDIVKRVAEEYNLTEWVAEQLYLVCLRELGS